MTRRVSAGNSKTWRVVPKTASLSGNRKPCNDGRQAPYDLIGDQINLMFDVLCPSLPHARAGKLAPLAVTSTRRSPQPPDLPTMSEAGLIRRDATRLGKLVKDAAVTVD